MIKDPEKKYIPAPSVPLADRTWPDKTLSAPPIWCSVDLRDGNQALVTPMGLEDKLAYFEMLCKIGFKHIEVGFPASSATELEFVRALVDGGRIPDDVTIQVLTPARGDLIEQTLESIRGAKRAAVHLYNNISPIHRKAIAYKGLTGIIIIRTSRRLNRQCLGRHCKFNNFSRNLHIHR